MIYLAVFVFPVMSFVVGLLSIGSLVRFVIEVNRDLRGVPRP